MGRAAVGSGSLGGCAAGAFGLPIPRQQAVELMGFDVTGDDPLEHVLQVLEGIETIHFGALCRNAELCRAATYGADGAELSCLRRDVPSPVARHSQRRSKSVKEREKLVIRSEPIAFFAVVRAELGQRGFLQGEMGVQIDLGGVDK